MTRNSIHNFNRGAYYKSFFIVLILFLSISLISAFEFDNIKVYDYEKKEVTIINALGFGSELAKVKLNTPLVYNVFDRGVGIEQLVAEFEINNLAGEYSNTFKQMEFYDENRNSQKINREFVYKYKVLTGTKAVNDYKTFCKNVIEEGKEIEKCSGEIVGTHQEDVFEWVNLEDVKKNKLPKGNITIGIFTDVINGERVEWIPTLFGARINEWAYWTSDLNNEIVAYWTFNETSGNIIDQVGSYDGIAGGGNSYQQKGIINGSVGFDATAAEAIEITGGNIGACIDNNCTISLWFNQTSADKTAFWEGSNANSIENSLSLLNGDTGIVRYADTGGAQTMWDYSFVNNGYWSQIVAVFNITDMILYINGTQRGFTTLTGTYNTAQDHSYFGCRHDSGSFEDCYSGEIDEVGMWNRTLTSQEISDLYNNGLGITYDSNPIPVFNIETNLVSPSTGTSVIDNSLNLTANFTMSNPYSGNITNATLFVWYSNSSLLNQTTILNLNGTSNETTINLTSIPFGSNFNWNFEGCALNETNGVVCSRALTNFTFSRNPFKEDASYYSPSIFETEKQKLELNITTISNIISITAHLYYNGTSYPSTISSISSNQYSIKNTLDTHLVQGNNTKGFFWEVVGKTSTDNILGNSTILTQQVNNTLLNICNSTFSTRIVNFTTYDAINPNPTINSQFKSTWNWWLGGGEVIENVSYENLSETTSQFEFCFYPNHTLYSNADFEFDANLFSQNNHYFWNQSLTNNSILHQKLYLLNDSVSTITLFKIVNSLQQGLPNRLVYIYLYDIGTGKEKVVSMLKTDHNGGDTSFINPINSLYKIVVVNNGTNELVVEPYKITSSPQTFIINDLNIFSQDKFKDVTYSLTFNNVTNDFVLIYNDPNNLITGGCMRVVKAMPSNFTILSDECLNATSGTLIYNIGSNVTGSYIGIFYALGSFSVIDLIYQIFESAQDIYGTIGNLDGTTLALIISGTAFFIGMFFGVGTSILFLILGYILSIAMNYQSGELIVPLVLIGSIGGFLIWKLKN